MPPALASKRAEAQSRGSQRRPAVPPARPVSALRAAAAQPTTAGCGSPASSRSHAAPTACSPPAPHATARRALTSLACSASQQLKCRMLTRYALIVRGAVSPNNRWVDERCHPIGPPRAGGAAQPAQHPVQRPGQVRKALTLAKDATQLPRVRQRTDQHMRLHTPQRLGQLQPVQLQLLARLVLEPDRALHPTGLAALAHRPQPQLADLTHQRGIGAIEPQPDQLLIQRRRQRVRVVVEPRLQIRPERLQTTRRPLPRRALTSQILRDRGRRQVPRPVACQASRTGSSVSFEPSWNLRDQRRSPPRDRLTQALSGVTLAGRRIRSDGPPSLPSCSAAAATSPKKTSRHLLSLPAITPAHRTVSAAVVPMLV